MTPLAQRWLRFSVVGLIGVGVQLAMLALLIWSGLHYLLATGIAVETAVLHNYAWHRRWTWGERSGVPDAGRLWRFHIANGLVSIASNLLWMRLLTGVWEIPAVPANLLAIGATALLNFALSERWVFKPAIAEPGR